MQTNPGLINKNQNIIIFIGLFIAVNLIGYGSSYKNLKAKDSSFVEEGLETDTIYSEVFKNSADNWIFHIIENGKIMIRQTHIPVIEGKIAFVDSIQAVKVSNLMISKMKNGIFPPSVQYKELDSLGVIYTKK
jgi:hypothetical protein